MYTYRATTSKAFQTDGMRINSTYKYFFSFLKFALIKIEMGIIVINPYPAKLNNLNFQPLEVVSRYRDPQLQVAENY